MRYILSFLSYLISLAILAAAFITSAPLHVAGEFVRLVPSFVDHKTSLPIETAIAVAERRTRRQLQRAKSFFERASTHSRWSGDHYDPGWAGVASVA